MDNNNSHRLFTFDPNSVTQTELIQLGLSEKTAAIFLKFRSKGFVFREKTDLKKVYGVTDKMYNKLGPFIVIGKKETPLVQLEKPVETKKKIVELNLADSIALTEINGVGPSFARRILKYRSLLGGFSSTTQLMEVYGITPEVFEKIKANVCVSGSPLTKININKDDFKTVNKHPYLSYELTKQIFAKRRKENISPENLKAIINDEALFTKLAPYLAF